MKETLPFNTILQGDCLEVLKTLPSESVDCVVTSPPYWALRDYGVAGQLGLEPTFQEYIDKLCNIFDEVRRVLKKEGTCWVNLGDSYGSGTGAGGTFLGRDKKTEAKIWGNKPVKGYEKSLLQIPSRFAIEMVNREWILRNEIIWHKTNCMPSSVKDRFTVDYEKVFFFVKSKKYFFKTQFEPYAHGSNVRYRQALRFGKSYNTKEPYKNNTPFSGKYKRGQGSVQSRGDDGDELIVGGTNSNGRNKRCVWQVATKPFKEAHSATYPEALIEPMIRAGCPVGGIVLDPFLGAGTTAVVAKKQDKKYIGIELNPEYIKIAKARIDAVLERLL